MLCICEDTHIYCAVLRGKSESNIFEDETQKKKMLDIVVTVQQQADLQVLAYCVLDNELHLMMKSDTYEQIKEGLKQMKQLYEDQFLSEDSAIRRKTLWKNTAIREITVEWKAVRQCIKFHMMPVKQNLVSRPEDYWWCSYNDYLGRKWLPVTETSILLSWLDGNDRKALKNFRQQHQQKISKRKSPSIY